MKQTLAIAVVVLSLHNWVWAEEAPVLAESKPATRAVRVGFSTTSMFLNPFGLATTGVGPSAIYEFLLSPRFSIGINLAYHWYLGQPQVTQLGYGLLLKHYFQTEQPRPGLRPYLEYGLLLSSTRITDRDSYAIAHDTRLTAGVDFVIFKSLPVIFCFDATYHLSWIGFFNNPSFNLMAAEFVLGARYLF